ncbi:MAG: hypothetical protein P9L92_00920 [Candidatus Electryonea clarkiae]|nr:hypothetical protein [Candidatus Electryonea clarkiae]MDP8287792.1 hypothetical protein [Candidatus Electryonea clarkiae]
MQLLEFPFAIIKLLLNLVMDAIAGDKKAIIGILIILGVVAAIIFWI